MGVSGEDLRDEDRSVGIETTDNADFKNQIRGFIRKIRGLTTLAYRFH